MWRISNKLGASKNMFKQDLQKDWESELLISLYHILNKVQFVSDIFWVNCDDGEVSCCSTRVVRCWSYYRLVCQDFSQCPPRVESHTAISRYIERGSAPDSWKIWQILPQLSDKWVWIYPRQGSSERAAVGKIVQISSLITSPIYQVVTRCCHTITTPFAALNPAFFEGCI